MILTVHRGVAEWPLVPMVCLFDLFKNKCGVSLLPVTGDFWLPWLLKYGGVWLWLGNHIRQIPQEPGIHLVGSHGLKSFQVLQLVLNLIFTSDGRDFIPLVSALKVQRLQRCGKTDFYWKLRKKNGWIPQPSQMSLFSYCLWEVEGGTSSIFLSWPMYLQEPLYSLHLLTNTAPTVP